MFIGHFALGYAAKRVVPHVPLAVLFAAVEWADILWPVLVAAGVEQVRIDPGNTVFTPLDFVSYPYSHSLLTLVLWGFAFGLVYRSASGRNGGIVTVLMLLVVSHWLLDFITHRPDMPLYPGGPKLGLGLWNSVPGTMIVEIAMYAAGVAIYWRTTRPRNAIGRWSSAGLALFLIVSYFVNAASGPPPSVTALWIFSIVGVAILLAWTWWADRNREPDGA
jgi:hypothetical protein